MKQYFRIHGDNIVECERILSIILSEINPLSIKKTLLSPSTETVDVVFKYLNKNFIWHLELLPGFNKSGRSRWAADIFDSLRKNGSFLDETPDAIITEIHQDREYILCAIEFCSALQAGNQAWQRSGRAFSTGRTGCPYLYIVDFVKYELNPETREQMNLRFPNAAVPYSYINYSRISGNFVAQVYVKSESFDKAHDPVLKNFDENNFADVELRRYIVKKMAHFDTYTEEETIFRKNFNVVCFLAGLTNSRNNLSVKEWIEIYNTHDDVINYCVNHKRFNFHKKIAQKAINGHLQNLLNIIDEYSTGLASKDLPLGIIPADKRQVFAKKVKTIYPHFNDQIITVLSNPTSNLILCVFKGFKPKGDDNRPDRGLLPLASMLSNNDCEIMTVLYGPLLYRNYQLLRNAPEKLMHNNGLWKSVLALSDYVLLDTPVLGHSQVKNIEDLLYTSGLKQKYTHLNTRSTSINNKLFSSIPREFHEDDVDTGIHFMFTVVLKSVSFEGMCNPPGGDWSGFSVVDHNAEERWLSLPRVSSEIEGKRPDHIIEISGVYDKPVLLSIESKEKSVNLEPNVGNRLKTYVKHLMKYVPNVERDFKKDSKWKRASKIVDANDFIMISAAAYLKNSAQQSNIVHNNSNCDILFIMNPQKGGWEIEAIPFTQSAKRLKNYMQKLIFSSSNNSIKFK